jgi:hypothetical protein
MFGNRAGEMIGVTVFSAVPIFTSLSTRSLTVSQADPDSRFSTTAIYFYGESFLRAGSTARESVESKHRAFRHSLPEFAWQR